jgi:hypothetical protein
LVKGRTPRLDRRRIMAGIGEPRQSRGIERKSGIGATSPSARMSSKDQNNPPLSFKNDTILSETGCGSSAPLPLGESGASLVKGGSERRVSAAWMPLTKTGRSSGITKNASAGNIGADLAGSRFCPGSAYRQAAP